MTDPGFGFEPAGFFANFDATSADATDNSAPSFFENWGATDEADYEAKTEALTWAE